MKIDRRLALWVCLILPACGDDADGLPAPTDGGEADGGLTRDDAARDGGVAPVGAPPGPTRPCPAGWSGEPGDCDPPPLADCSANTLALPDGTCSAAWACPPAWSPIEGGYGCAPDPLREDCPAGSFAQPDGTCTAVWRCPPGWARVSPEGGCAVEACPVGEVPAEAGGCVALAAPDCAAPVWPEGAVFVAPGGVGDGGAGAPLGSIAEALGEGRPVALLPGDHAVDDVVLGDGAHLVGVCPSAVRLRGALLVDGAGVHVERVSLLAREPEPALRVEGGDVSLSEVVVDGPVLGAGGAIEGADLRAHGGTWTLTRSPLACRRCQFEDAPLVLAAGGTLSEIAAHQTGPSDALRATGPLTLSAAQIDAAGTGLALQGDGPHDVERLRVGGARVAVDLRGGATLRDVFVTGATWRGAQVVNEADAVFEGVTVVDLQGEPDGFALGVDGARVQVTRLYGAGIRGRGIVVAGEATLTQVIVRDVTQGAARESGCLGSGDGGTARVDGALLEGCTGYGVLARADGDVEVARLRVHDTRPRADGLLGNALRVDGAAAVRVSDAWLQGAVSAGVSLRAGRAGAAVDLTRVSLRQVAHQPATGLHGEGVFATGPFALTTTDTWIGDVQGYGLVDVGGRWRGRRLVIDGVATRPDSTYSVGVYAGDDADADLAQAYITRTTAVAVSGTGAVTGDVRLRVAGLLTEGLRTERGGPSFCAAQLGAGDHDGDYLLEDSVIRDVPNCGVAVIDAAATARRVRVSELSTHRPNEVAFKVNEGRLDLVDVLGSGPRRGVRVGEDDGSGPSELRAERAVFREVGEGIWVNPGSHAELTDVAFHDVESGIGVSPGASVSGTGFTVRGALVGVLLADGVAEVDDVGIHDMGLYGVIAQGSDARLTLRGVVVAGVERGGDGFGGQAVVVEDGEASISGADLRACVGFGIYANRATLGLEDVHIHGVREDEEGRADGINTLEGRLVGADVHLYDTPRAGVVLEDTRADLRGGSIRGHRFGAVLTGESQLDERDVVYADNERDQRTCAARCLDRPERP